jgi:hypothetical protein
MANFILLNRAGLKLALGLITSSAAILPEVYKFIKIFLLEAKSLFLVKSKESEPT